MNPQDRVLLIGESAAVGDLRTEIANAARSQAKVLILGETGVGKEVTARLIHRGGARREHPFLAVNCSGIPETLLESELFGHLRGSFTGAYRDKPGLVRMADRGTLFLDELGEMSLRMQAVLLRFAETGEVQPVGSDTRTQTSNVRLITATNRDLRGEVEAATFRKDLYYRLNVIEIHVPALRERGDDIRLLLRHFLREASQVHEAPCPKLAPQAEELLVRYSWPGNIRELKNVAERLAVRHDNETITPEMLPEEIQNTGEASSVRRDAGSLGGSVASPGALGPYGPVGLGARGDVATVTRTSGHRVGSEEVDQVWASLKAGENFWAAVHQRFKSHDFTREDLREVIRRGLAETRGSYRQLVTLFHMPSSDYKRFLSFLSQHQCNVAYKPYRDEAARRMEDSRASETYEAAS